MRDGPILGRIGITIALERPRSAPASIRLPGLDGIAGQFVVDAILLERLGRRAHDGLADLELAPFPGFRARAIDLLLTGGHLEACPGGRLAGTFDIDHQA